MISPQTIGFPSDNEKTQNGSVTTMAIIPRNNVETARSLVPAVFILVLFISLYIVFNQIMVYPLVLRRDEKEYLHAKKKYSNLMVDISDIPAHNGNETVIEVSSLDGIIRNVDNLLKSVLHKAEKRKHSYWVLDGLTRYEYVSRNGKTVHAPRITKTFKVSKRE